MKMNVCDLTVSRTVNATAQEIFDIWLDSKSPGGPWFGAIKVILNPVVDGLFYHAVEHEGKAWHHYGRFVELNRPGRIEHTWVSEATRGLESVVSITLVPSDGGTEITLRHSGVPDDEMGRQHESGWVWMLQTIEQRCEEQRAKASRSYARGES